MGPGALPRAGHVGRVTRFASAAPVPAHPGPDGTPCHLVPLAPEDLPAVPPRALLHAWRTAAGAAQAERVAEGRAFRFAAADGTGPELALADADAACWAGAVEASVGLHTVHGVALCLRLLALVDALARLHWLKPLFTLDPDGAEFHPSLLAAAATQRLTAHARLDDTRLRAALSRCLPNALPKTGVSA